MGAFSGLGKAQSTKGGNYVQPGNYLFQIKRVKMQKGQVGGKHWFIAELLVLESEQTSTDHKPNPVNTEPSMVVEVAPKKDFDDMTPKEQLGLGNIKAFLHAAYSALALSEGEDPPDEDDIGEEAADMAVSEDNPLVGVKLLGKAFHKSTQKGGVFTRINWSLPDEE